MHVLTVRHSATRRCGRSREDGEGLQTEGDPGIVGVDNPLISPEPWYAPGDDFARRHVHQVRHETIQAEHADVADRDRGPVRRPGGANTAGPLAAIPNGVRRNMQYPIT